MGNRPRLGVLDGFPQLSEQRAVRIHLVVHGLHYDDGEVDLGEVLLELQAAVDSDKDVEAS